MRSTNLGTIAKVAYKCWPIYDFLTHLVKRNNTDGNIKFDVWEEQFDI